MDEAVIQPWAVVVLGRWNRSILTPFNIAKEMFKREGDLKATMNIEVPVNAVAPNRIIVDDVAVLVHEDRLVLDVGRDNYTALERGTLAAARAVEWLDRTPMTAAGMNLTFELSSIASDAPVATNKQWDAALERERYPIKTHHAGRTVAWGDGTITVVTNRLTEGGSYALVNFERRSENTKELADWLKTPVEQFREQTEKMLALLKEGGVS